MAFSVNTNASALAALRTLNATNRALGETQSRINTGFKVGGAKDNASTFAIAQGMRGDIAGLKAVQESLSLGQATVNVALSAAQQISDKLSELKQKVTQGQAPNVDRNAIQNDIDAIIESIDAVAIAAQFNGVNLLKNGATDLDVVSSLDRQDSATVNVAKITVAAQDLSAGTLGIGSIDITGKIATFEQATGLTFTNGDVFEVQVTNSQGKLINYQFELTDGAGPLTTAVTDTDGSADGNIAVAVLSDTTADSTATTLGKLIDAMNSVGLTAVIASDGTITVTSPNGINNATSSNTELTAQVSGSDPSAAMGAVENAINTVKTALAKLGTAANQLEAQGDFVKSLTDTLTEGVSTLVDADLAEESATLQALQTKQQLGIQALAIANQQSGAVLALFR
ncbi:MAG: flagellin [Rhodospirillales bacterium]|nr:flagellin [Rhodospirillales bacterium]